MNTAPEPEKADSQSHVTVPNTSSPPSSANAIFRPTRGLVSEQNLATPLGSAWLGIVFAGGCFPWLAVLLVVVVLTVISGFHAISLARLLDGLLSLTLSSCVGIICTIIGTIPAYCILQFWRFCTNWILTERGACGVFGGLTGFLCTTGGGLFIASSILLTSEWYFYLAIVVGAVALGHFGGIFRCSMKRKSLNWFKSPFLDPQKRISIKFLMGITTVLAIFVACCKAAGDAGLRIGVAWVMYGALQSLLLVVEHSWRTRISGISPSETNHVETR